MGSNVGNGYLLSLYLLRKHNTLICEILRAYADN